MSANSQPCGCHDPVVLDVKVSDLGDGVIPPIDEFARTLDAIASDHGSIESQLGDLDLAGLDASLALLEYPSIDLDLEDDLPSLADLMLVLERFPGLKLTLSY